MGDSRHKRRYPQAPRERMTADWKQAVRTALQNNKLSGHGPADQTQLARAIGVHKTAITKMFEADSSALVIPICKALGLRMPMEPVDPDDELGQALSGLEPAQQNTVLEFAQFLLAKYPRRDS